MGGRQTSAISAAYKSSLFAFTPSSSARTRPLLPPGAFSFLYFAALLFLLWLWSAGTVAGWPSKEAAKSGGQRQLPGSGGSVFEAGLGCLQVRVGVDAWLGEAEDRHEEQRGERQRQQAKTRQLRVHIVVNK